MPVLPLIDLLILISWTSFMWAFIHKASWLAFGLTYTVLGRTPYDFVLGGGACLLFSIALAARTWVKANEGSLLHRGLHPAPVTYEEAARPARAGEFPAADSPS